MSYHEANIDRVYNLEAEVKELSAQRKALRAERDALAAALREAQDDAGNLRVTLQDAENECADLKRLIAGMVAKIHWPMAHTLGMTAEVAAARAALAKVQG